mgnify:CR=1 FL=1
MTAGRFTRVMARLAVALLLSCGAAHGQQMPDPSLIHGKALPAPELPDGTVTVRVVREAIGNDVPGQRVTAVLGSGTRTAETDAQGRAQFGDLPKGQEGRAEVTVDGEKLVSDPFTVPATGGLRVILVAGIARAAERKAQEAAAAASAPATKGAVVFGGNSRVLMQFEDDGLQVFYVLEVLNNARARVDIGGPLIVDLPPGSGGATALQGSSPSATVTGNRLTITGPFAPGATTVQVAYRLRYDSPNLTFRQVWPAAMPQVTVGVQKVGNLRLSSPQLQLTNDIRTDDGTVFILGSGPSLPAGGELTLNLTGLPFHSRTPRLVALSLAVVVAGLGLWLAFATGGAAPGDARRALEHRRDSLLGDLEQVEVRRRAGGADAAKLGGRRQRILAELEQIYGELDDAPLGPQGGGEGSAA